MPRKPRMFSAGVPCHVIQRGNNRSLWSSYHVNVGLKPRKLLSPHLSYLALGKDMESVESNYRSLFALELEQSIISAISDVAKFKMPFGDNRFKKEIELALGRSIGFDKKDDRGK